MSLFLLVLVAIVALVLLILAGILIYESIRRARCPHTDVRLRRQERYGTFYFAEVCMHCGKSSGARP